MESHTTENTLDRCSQTAVHGRLASELIRETVKNTDSMDPTPDSQNQGRSWDMCLPGEAESRGFRHLCLSFIETRALKWQLFIKTNRNNLLTAGELSSFTPGAINNLTREKAPLARGDESTVPRQAKRTLTSS